MARSTSSHKTYGKSGLSALWSVWCKRQTFRHGWRLSWHNRGYARRQDRENSLFFVGGCAWEVSPKEGWYSYQLYERWWFCLFAYYHQRVYKKSNSYRKTKTRLLSAFYIRLLRVKEWKDSAWQKVRFFKTRL